MRNTSNCTLRITKSTPKKPCCSSEKTDKEAALQTLRQRFPCVRPMPRRGGINARLAYDFFRFLKRPQDEITRHFGGDGHTVQPWVAKTPNTERQLDRHDPYGAATVLNRPFPLDWTGDLLGTVADDEVVRSWSIGGRTAYRAEAWGAEGGRGEYAWSETGYRLFVSRGALLSLLKVSERSLVVTLMLQKYHRGKSSGHLGGTGAFTHRSLVVVINERGQIWSPRSLSRQAKEALATLTPYRRRDFYPRFRAIAGLTDEWHCRRDNLPDLDDIDLVFINSPNGS